MHRLHDTIPAGQGGAPVLLAMRAMAPLRTHCRAAPRFARWSFHSRSGRRGVIDIKHIADALGATKKIGQSYNCRCPVHDDARASLNVAEGKDGKVLFGHIATLPVKLNC
jgi:hypothetical protein